MGIHETGNDTFLAQINHGSLTGRAVSFPSDPLDGAVFYNHGISVEIAVICCENFSVYKDISVCIAHFTRSFINIISEILRVLQSFCHKNIRFEQAEDDVD